jgi:hypothetical protein
MTEFQKTALGLTCVSALLLALNFFSFNLPNIIMRVFFNQ